LGEAARQTDPDRVRPGGEVERGRPLLFKLSIGIIASALALNILWIGVLAWLPGRLVGIW